MSEIGDLVTKLRVAQGKRDILAGEYGDKTEEVDALRDKLRTHIANEIWDMIMDKYTMCDISKTGDDSILIEKPYSGTWVHVCHIAETIVLKMGLEE